MKKYLGVDGFLDFDDFVELVSRMGFDLAVTSVVVLLIYYRMYRDKDFVFTYFIFNVITFSICALLRKVPMELGFALGLFAVFGILRYRTEEIRLRDLTYMFIVIGLGIVNAVANKKVSLAELLLVNAVIVAIAAAIEFHPGLRRHGTTSMLYDNLPLLRRGREAQLYADLHERTGFDVTGVKVQRVDLLRDVAEIVVSHTVETRPRERTNSGVSNAAHTDPLGSTPRQSGAEPKA